MNSNYSLCESKKQYRVLIVDYDKDFYDRVSKTLSEDGFKITWVNSGQFVLEQAILLSPHLILMEVETPNLNGIKLCEIIRSTPELSNIIVAFITKQIDDYIQVSAFQAGCDDFYFKTIKPKLLNYRLLAHLNHLTNKRNIITETKSVNANNNLFMEYYSLS